MQQDLENWFGRGAGDPDVFGYPGESKELIKVIPKQTTPKVYHKKHWSEVMRNPNTYGPREVGDNDPASPEEAGY